MYLKIGIADVFIKEAHQECQNVLEKAFGPIQSYLAEFKDNFQGLIDTNTEKELDVFLATEKTFDEYLEKIGEFQVGMIVYVFNTFLKNISFYFGRSTSKN
jgi:ABC-type phosphate transport system auxiliary subunit